MVLLLATGGPSARSTRLASLPVLTWLGAISYPIYLVHESLILLAVKITEPASVPTLVFAFAVVALVTLVLSVLLHWFVELPAIAAARRRTRRAAEADSPPATHTPG